MSAIGSYILRNKSIQSCGMYEHTYNSMLSCPDLSSMQDLDIGQIDPIENQKTDLSIVASEKQNKKPITDRFTLECLRPGSLLRRLCTTIVPRAGSLLRRLCAMIVPPNGSTTSGHGDHRGDRCEMEEPCGEDTRSGWAREDEVWGWGVKMLVNHGGEARRI